MQTYFNPTKKWFDPKLKKNVLNHYVCNILATSLLLSMYSPSCSIRKWSPPQEKKHGDKSVNMTDMLPARKYIDKKDRKTPGPFIIQGLYLKLNIFKSIVSQF